jgi:serine protease Do
VLQARRSWLLLLGLLLCCSAASAQEADLTPEEAARRALRRSPIVELYEKCQPAVAFITFPVPKGGNPVLNEFFALPGVPEEVGVGSGFFVHESGYLLTNAHAVSSIAMVAHLSDGKSYPIDVVGIDRSIDLAVVRIHPPDPVKTVPLARGNDVMIGETIVVIGSPHGLKQSCITGVLAAQGRDVTASGMQLHNMLQLNAAINPGNSGGPVFNIVGEVLGMVAAHKQDGQSVAFAIPAQTMRKALPRLLDVERRHSIQTGLMFANDGSARVDFVGSETPAAAAGIQVGDVVRTIGGRRILSESDFHLGLLGSKPGDVVTLKMTRGKEPVEAKLKLGKRTKPDTEWLLGQLGLRAQPLDPKQASAMHLRVARGVVLTDVKPALFPDKQKPEPGDVLVRINDWRPEDFDHVGRLLAEAVPGKAVKLVFLRKRENTVTRMDVTVTLPK